MTQTALIGFKGFSAHFAIIVEVRVKANTVSTSGLQVDQGRRVGIVLWKIHIKLKAAVGIWGVCWTCDENLKTQRKERFLQHQLVKGQLLITHKENQEKVEALLTVNID